MIIVPGTLNEYISRINSKKPFTLVRYGDGEWSCILGHKGKNCDGVVYSEELRLSLQNTLLDRKSYDYGILAIATRTYKKEIEEFLVRHKILIQWTEATFLVAANRHGELSPFVQSLQERRLLYVGPPHLRKIEEFLPISKFLEIHPVNAFAHRQEIIREILYHKNESDFVGISAGPAAKVIIHSLFDRIGNTHSVIDFGSLWDGYAGVSSRKYMRRSTWPEILQRNLNESGLASNS